MYVFMGDFSMDLDTHREGKKKEKKLLCVFVCVSLGSKAVAEISSLESLLTLCVGLSLCLYVCVSLSERLSQEFQCGKYGIREELEV
jgi:hypothetical protein